MADGREVPIEQDIAVIRAKIESIDARVAKLEAFVIAMDLKLDGKLTVLEAKLDGKMSGIETRVWACLMAAAVALASALISFLSKR